MTDHAENNRRIAKNTLFLYFRTILIMLVTLYTSRVVLNMLGVEDYGVYTAVGGVVSLFAVISGAMSNAVSRFITYGIGKGNSDQLNNIFTTSVNVQILISVIILLLGETLGVWFVNSKMNIPYDRMAPANWVLHCSLITFVINLISVPYNACIIAYEHMKAYAYISIIDAILKLGVAFMLVVSPVDKLIAYSILLVIASLGVRLMYGLYCRRHFPECRYHFRFDKNLFREMFGFAGWNFFGNATSILNLQGVNVLINIFFGVIANSARGIASQVEAAVNQLVLTFSTAVNPQITKSYALGDKDRMFYLICKGAKFAYFLLLIFALPLIFEADAVLKIWLVDVPENSAMFMRLSIVGSMITILGNSGYTACLATGNIRNYSIVITAIGSLNFFLTWALYKMGCSVQITYYVYIAVYAIIQIVRLFLMKGMLGFPVMMFVKEVLWKIFVPTVSAIVLPLILSRVMDPSFGRLVLVCISSVIWSVFCIYVFGLSKGEKSVIYEKCR